MNLVPAPDRTYKRAVVTQAYGRDCSRKSAADPVCVLTLETG